MSSEKLSQLSFIALDKNVEAIEEMLLGAGALSISANTASHEEVFQIMPDEQPLWHKTKITALYDETMFNFQVLDIIEQTLQLQHPINYQTETVTEQDWVSITQRHFQPQCYNDALWIYPSWHEPPSGDAIVMLDPGLAFGTGTHPTTQLCLQWLAEHPPVGQTVIDYGCGSGILALAAAALGADTVWATDHDPQALESTTNNAKLNNWLQSQQLHIVTAEALPSKPAPLVLANILANPLIELRPQLEQLVEPQGTLVLSGILTTEIDKITQAYQATFDISDITTQQEWVRITLRKP
jgi:ribosomal protein L11 methyltransferase